MCTQGAREGRVRSRQQVIVRLPVGLLSHLRFTMSVSVKDLKTYSSFARRFAGKFVRDRMEERRVPVLPAPHRPEPAKWSDERLTVSWLGHATVLINFYGTWLLTDPALRPRIGVRVERGQFPDRSEEHTSELQSRLHL